MTTQSDYKKYVRLQAILNGEVKKAKSIAGLQEMPDDVWDDEKRRMDWLAADKAQWNYNTGRLARLKHLQDRCFPKKEWVIQEIEAFFENEEGPLY